MPEPVLEFDQVTRRFAGPPEVTSLEDCTLSIEAGAFVTVRGPSGSGKSSWLHLAELLDRPTEGTIRLAGHDTSTISDRKRTALRAAHIGFVFQAFYLLPQRTVRENLELQGIYQGVPPRQRSVEAERIAERVGLTHRLDSFAGTLSGGEMQRSAIGRALFGTPNIMLCDEPTGNLDSVNGAQIVDLLHRLNDDGITIVIITHDPDLAAHGSQRFTVRDGRFHRE